MSSFHFNHIEIAVPRTQVGLHIYAGKRKKCAHVHKNDLPEITLPPEAFDALPLMVSVSTFKDETALGSFEDDIRRYPYLVVHWFRKALMDVLKQHAAIVERDYVDGIKVYLTDEVNSSGICTVYKRYIIRLYWGTETNVMQVVFQYDGKASVLNITLAEMESYAGCANKIVQNKETFKLSSLPPWFALDIQQARAFVNRPIQARYDIVARKQDLFKNRYLEFYTEINQFKKWFDENPGLQELLPTKEVLWSTPGVNAVKQVPENARNLVFGNNRYGFEAKRDYPEFGPAKTSAVPKVRLLMIGPERERASVRTFALRIRSGDLATKFRKLTGFTPEWYDGNHVFFEDEKNPLPEIEAQLRHFKMDPAAHTIALYFSSIPKGKSDIESAAVYFRVKEICLHYAISTQGIYIDTLKNADFGRYVLTNLAAALTAKAGGCPWILPKSEQSEDLIIGIGAYKSRHFEYKFLGSAFCFRGDGSFQELECFHERDVDLLEGSIFKAIQRFKASQSNVKRLILHYYKQISGQEEEVITSMLRSIQLSIPVIVVTVNKTRSADALLFDTGYAGVMPMSGVYTRLKDDIYLLCNNARYDQATTPRFHPAAVKMHIHASQKTILDDQHAIAGIMRQVYQFSRIYWKSVAQQHLPVTLAYPSMLAEMLPFFKEPMLPAFGKNNLFFL
jgi:hypothetical protein